MEQKYLQQFVYFMQNTKGLSRKQSQRRDALLARDIVVNSDNKAQSSSKIFKPLSALDTALYLSKFNNRMGFKFLTHDFDYANDGSPDTMEQLITQISTIIQSKEIQIPSSLWALLNGFLSKGDWMDTYGNKHKSYFADKEWVEWSNTHEKHPLKNADFEKEILAFKNTTKIIAPSLTTMCEKASEGLSIKIKTEGTDSVEFYTNTFFLFKVLKRIFNMMNRRVEHCPNVTISIKRSIDSAGRMLRKIIVTQYGSFANQPLDDLKQRLDNSPDAGDFGSIRTDLNGYCLWQVESLWDNKPFRWNILKSSEMEKDVEPLEEDNVIGFTHIFTFYLV